VTINGQTFNPGDVVVTSEIKGKTTDTFAEVAHVASQAEERDPAEPVLAQPAAGLEQTSDIEKLNGHMPDINLELLRTVKESQEFQAIQSRLAQSLPTDSWQEDDAHFFAFQLLPADESSPNSHEPPVAVFAMRLPEPVPISAVIVTPSADGQEAEVVDLRQPDSGYVALLAS
jgi:hypothetical protein